MYKRIELFAFLLVIASLSGNAQQNIIKTGITDVLSGHFNLSYERSLNEKQSATLKIGYWKATISPFVSEETITPEAYTFQEAGGGFNASAEYRFYLGASSTLRGLYIAPYFRYFSQAVLFTDEIDTRLFDVHSSLNTSGIGAQIGYQLIVNNAFTVDFYFFGAGVDQYNVKLKYSLQQPQAGFDYNSITDDVSEVFEDINYLESRLEHHVSNDKLISKIPFLFPGFRIGINVGYAF